MCRSKSLAKDMRQGDGARRSSLRGTLKQRPTYLGGRAHNLYSTSQGV
jgi:hypothetical protein